MNFVHEVSLTELDDHETLENYPIPTISAITVYPEYQLTNVVDLLRETYTSLLSSQDAVDTNLVSVLASVSGGASNHVPSIIINNNNDFLDCLMTLPLISCQTASLNKPLQALGGYIQRFYIQNNNNNGNNNDFINQPQLFYIHNNNNNDFINQQ